MCVAKPPLAAIVSSNPLHSNSCVLTTLWQTECTTLGVRHLLLKLLLIKILHLHIDCGLSSSPSYIGFCYCLQVVIEMYYCSACYRPV